MKTSASALTVLVGLSLLTGCQPRGLFFGTVTRTAFSVGGGVATPGEVGLGYHRGEIAIIPKNTAGNTYSVYGGTDNEFSWSNGLAVAQTFATGAAALAAVGENPIPSDNNAQNGPLVFATGTTSGLNLHFADAASQTPGLLFGYRRAEGVWIPTKEDATETSPVYADISIVYLPTSSPEGSKKFDDREPVLSGATRIKQRFATGRAAIKIAQNPVIRAKLALAAGAGVTAATAALVGRTAYAQKLAAVTATATQAKILGSARSTLASDRIDVPEDYLRFVNVTVPNLTPAPLARLQTALADLVP